MIIRFIGTYAYDVSFSPKRRVNPTRFDGLYLMHHSSNVSTYIKLYDNDKVSKASDPKVPVGCNIMENPAEAFLHLKSPLVEYIDEISMQLSLDCKCTHIGIQKGLASSKLYPHGGEKALAEFDIKHETVRNRIFLSFYANSSLADDFSFGRINIGKPRGKCYSEFGTSKNDVVIVHKKHYKKERCAAAGLVYSMADPEYKQDGEEYDNNVDNFTASGGIIEFKNAQFNIDQTIKEMMKSAGDLTAKVLQEGAVVDYIIMYGLAANFKEGSAKLVSLQLDFVQQKAIAVTSDTPVEMQHAMNWLLMNINLN